MRKRDERGPLCNYFKHVARHEPIGRNEELAMISEYCKSRDPVLAKRLIDANLRFVVSVARRYHRYSGLDLEELIQQGNLGLLDALDRYDQARNVRLLSYAGWSIRSFIERHVNKQLASATKETSFADSDPSIATTAESAEEQYENAEWVKRGSSLIRSFRAKLHGRNAVLMDQRLCTDEPKTLEEVGREFGVCRERTRALELALMNKLRAYMAEHLPDCRSQLAEAG